MTPWVVPVHDPTSRLEPDARATRLRTAALASAVALVIALPLAFVVAGPSDTIGLSGTPGGSSGTAASVAEDTSSEPEPRSQDADTMDPAPGPAGPADASSGTGGGSTGSPAGAFCGAEERADGVAAQACLLTQGPDTWGRLHYRNDTGTALRAELTVRRPDGETVDVSCALPADGEPGLCETPREPTVAEPDAGPADPDAADDRSTPATDGGWRDDAYAVAARVTDGDGERALLGVSADHDES